MAESLKVKQVIIKSLLICQIQRHYFLNISVHCNLMLSVQGDIILHVPQGRGEERLIANSLDQPPNMEFATDARIICV